MAIHIGLVEDNTTLRKRLLDNFSYFKSVEVVISCTTSEEFTRKLPTLENKPSIVLMDIELPGATGIETTQWLNENYPEIAVIMFTVYEDINKIYQSIKAGASGYLLKDENPKNIIQSIDELQNGGAPMSSLIAKKIITDIQSFKKAETSTNNFNLSERELRILEYLVEGKTYKDIADHLIISPHTVKTHIKNVYKKLHVHSRAQAVQKAISNKLV